MSNCEITLKLGNKDSMTFNSDRELDGELLRQASTLKSWYKLSNGKLDKIFQVDTQAEALDIVDEISKEYKEALRTRGYSKESDVKDPELERITEGDLEMKGHISGTISVSATVKSIGGKGDLNSKAISGFNKDWENAFRTMEAKAKYGNNVEQYGPHLYDADITEKWKKQEAKNNLTAKLGEDVHIIKELIFRHHNDPSIVIDDSKCKYLKGETFTKSLTVLQNIANSIIAKYPGAKFIPEYSIISKKFDNNIQEYLKNNGQPGRMQSSGRLDLLIIDKDGKAHIYDWKTSLHPVGDWAEMDNAKCRENGWKTSAQKITNLLQIGSYGAILQQYGLEVGDKVLECFLLDFDVTKDASGNWIPSDIKPVRYDPPVANPKGITQQSMANARQQQMEFIYTNNRFIDCSNLKPSNDILKTIFPETDLANTHIKQFEASIEYYKKKPNFIHELKNPDSNEYKRGNRFVFFKNGLGNKTAEPVYCKTMEEVDEKLKEYVAELEKYKSTELLHFAKNLQKVMATTGMSDDAIYGEWLSAFNDESRTFLIQSFKKYYKNGWSLVQNDDLNSNGIFLFNKNDKMEMVILTEKDPRYLIRLNDHENICGTKLADNANGTDPYFMFKSYTGNMLFMKGMAILATNPKLLGDCKLAGMKVVNPWHATEFYSYSNSKLVDNWNLICKTFPETHAPTMSMDDFMNDTDAYMATALELSCSLDYNIFADKICATNPDKEYTTEVITDMMYKMRKEYGEESCNSVQTDVGRVYYNLSQALLAADGYCFTDEADYAKYLNAISPSGTHITAADQSNSVLVRSMGKLMSYYREMYTSSFTNIASQFTELVTKVFDTWGFNAAVDSPTKFWAQFFEQDENGNVTTMRLKNPNSEFFTKGCTKEQTESAQNLIEFIADYFNSIKHPNWGEEQIIMAKATGEYYEMPLQEASFGQFVRDQYNRNGILGVGKGLWNSFKSSVKPLSEEVFEGGRKTQREYEAKRSPYVGAFNPYLNITDKQRTDLLAQNNREWCTDIQTLFLETAAAQCVTNASKKIIPQCLAFKTALKWSNSIGAYTPELSEWMEKYINNKVLKQKINDASLDWVKDVIGALKSITSAATLGFSTRPFARELLVDLYQANTRAFTKILPDITCDDFTWAMSVVGRYTPISLGGENKLVELCKRFAMSSYSASEMAFSEKVKKYGLRQGWNEMMYLGSKLPDDLFRMAICIAKMRHEGCFDAYVESDDGQIEYQIWKDKRFDKLFNSDGTIIKKEDSDDKLEWARQNSKYLQYIQDWKKVGIEVEYGKTLPDCYSPHEKATVRSMASSLYGFFDTEDKSLVSATVLGSLFMQYKTFISAKISQHAKIAGWENLWHTYQVTDDETGELMYKRLATDEEKAEGKGKWIFLKESELTEADRENAIPWMHESGTFSQGMIQATGSFIQELLNCRTQEDFNLLWKDENRRAQLINGLSDTLGLLVFAAIIKLIYGADTVNNKQDQDWWTQWSYGVLIGFAEDGPVNHVVSSALGDGTPPAISSIQQWMTTCNSVLSGNRSVANGLVSAFGATRELRGLSMFGKR